MKNRAISERIESIRISYFWTAQLRKEILLGNIGPVQFRKELSLAKKLGSLLLSKNTWTSTISERMESHKKIWKAYYLIYLVQTPSWCPNNLPQPAWCLKELFFLSDLSWLQADLCSNFYVISTSFSILSTMPLCTRYISNIGIKTGLKRFSLCNNLLAEIYFSFLLMKYRAISERIESIRNSYFWPA